MTSGWPHLSADRERVLFVADEVTLDTHELAAWLENPELTLERLVDTVGRLHAPLLGGLDLPDLQGFQHWLVAGRREHDALATRAAYRLTADPRLSLERAAYWARIASDAAPADASAAALLLERLRTLGESGEARALGAAFAERFAAADIAWPPPDAQPADDTGAVEAAADGTLSATSMGGTSSAPEQSVGAAIEADAPREPGYREEKRLSVPDSRRRRDGVSRR